MDWDQRIPNEPLFNRNFLLTKPVIIPDHRPVSTYGTGLQPVGQFRPQEQFNYNPSAELSLARYWHDNFLRPTGLPTIYSVVPSAKLSLENLVKMYPTKPWMQGVQRNINAESQVKPYQPILNKDCTDFIRQPLIFTGTRPGPGPEPGPQFGNVKWDIKTSIKGGHTTT